jgi:hypothetical protein
LSESDLLVIVPVLTCIISAVGILVFTRLRQGPLISPITISLLLMFSIFGVRPLLMMEADLYSFYGSDVRRGFETAEWVGLLATIALVVGYGFSKAIRSSREPSASVAVVGSDTDESSDVALSRIKVAAVISGGLLVAWLLVMVVLGGGVSFLTVLFAGRSDAVNARLTGLPAVVPALPVVAALIMALARIGTERVRRLARSETVVYWVIIALCVIPPSALGTRRFLIPCVLAGLLGAVLPRWNKVVSLRMVALAVVGFLALAIFPFVRSAGSRTQSSDLAGAMVDYFQSEGLTGTLQGFFVSYDTEMFNYISYLAPRLGDSIEYGLGRGTLGDLLLAPIPAAFAPVETWSNQILIAAFGGVCGPSVCPVPSVVGILFYDLALPGVFVGMLLIGVLLARFDGAFLGAKGPKLAVLLVLAAFTPQLVRGNTISQLWIAAQALVLLLLADYVVKRICRARERTLAERARFRAPLVSTPLRMRAKPQ